MIPAALKLLATRHDLLTQHLGAYAVLASAEAGEWATAMRRHAVWTGAAAVLALLGLGTACMAALFAAALPLSGMPAPWLLVALPLGLLIAAAGCVMPLRQPLPAFDALRTQLHLDAQMWQQVAHPASSPVQGDATPTQPSASSSAS